MKGDILTLCGAFLYGVSNLSQEYLVKQIDRVEFLAMLGLFGSLVSGLQLAVLEHADLAALFASPDARTLLAYLLAFALCMLAIYSLLPLVLQQSSAVTMNLSFLTSDFFSVAFAVLLFRARLIALYFVAFAVIIAGLVIYNLADTGLSLRQMGRRALRFCGCAGAALADDDDELVDQADSDQAAGSAGHLTRRDGVQQDLSSSGGPASTENDDECAELPVAFSTPSTPVLLAAASEAEAAGMLGHPASAGLGEPRPAMQRSYGGVAEHHPPLSSAQVLGL